MKVDYRFSPQRPLNQNTPSFGVSLRRTARFQKYCDKVNTMEKDIYEHTMKHVSQIFDVQGDSHECIVVDLTEKAAQELNNGHLPQEPAGLMYKLYIIGKENFGKVSKTVQFDIAHQESIPVKISEIAQDLICHPFE